MVNMLGGKFTARVRAWSCKNSPRKGNHEEFPLPIRDLASLLLRRSRVATGRKNMTLTKPPAKSSVEVYINGTEEVVKNFEGTSKEDHGFLRACFV